MKAEDRGREWQKNKSKERITNGPLAMLLVVPHSNTGTTGKSPGQHSEKLKDNNRMWLAQKCQGTTLTDTVQDKQCTH